MSETKPNPEHPLSSADCINCVSGGTLAPQGICCRDLRATLGRFPTGVTIVTALSKEGHAAGVTISSFNSVSLDPPLILWSLSQHSPKLDVFRHVERYAINVLSAGQRALSDRFASRMGDRFADVSVHAGLGGTPLIDGCCAWFECTQEAQHPGGDHLVFVGRVERFAPGESTSPLVFFNGAYRQLEEG